jgi:dynein heavy chain
MTSEGMREAEKFADTFDKYNFIWLTEKQTHLNNFLKYGKNLTEKDIEQIENGSLDLPERKPDMNDFRNIIEYYGELYDEIGKIESTFTIQKSWMRINLKELIIRLQNHVCKWSLVFKEYLRNKVIEDLKELDDFIISSTEVINQVPSNDDYELLLKILKILSTINEREKQVEDMFVPLKQIVGLLETYDVTFDEQIGNQFAVLPEKWITLKKLAMAVKQNIASVQTYQVDLIKKRINLFDLRTKLYQEKFHKLPVSNVRSYKMQC